MSTWDDVTKSDREDEERRRVEAGVVNRRLYPHGRTLFYEGDDTAGFMAAMAGLGVDVTLQVHVPADLLYDVGRWPMGS